jgi:hypothetical protein
MSSNDTFDTAGSSPEEYHAQGPTADSPETGTTYDATGEPEVTPHDQAMTQEEINSSDPNAASSGGLAGDLGLSSERTGPADETGSMHGIEGTGSTGGAVRRTTGTVPTHRSEDEVDAGVDPDAAREENTAEVPPHEFDPSRNPGHS